MYQILFDMNTALCDRFYSLNPFVVREQRFHDVLLIYARLIDQNKRNKKTDKRGTTYSNGVIRRPATNDDWY